ncbi:hypothetical protein ACH4NR_32295 [Streptomyces globisporus]|uniref:hypothetical protein n=1 Tax=Streptomyces albovinaceus subgroup TaxID=1482558 RepID=UPI00117BE8EC|nr:hypothetical protein [Streptomyces albovinaceus]WSF81562.1 hypothetical protein OG838_35960 [Streptomyces globisporus]
MTRSTGSAAPAVTGGEGGSPGRDHLVRPRRRTPQALPGHGGPMRLPLAALTAVLLLSGCTSVHPAPGSPAPEHRPAGQAVPLRSAPPPAPPTSTPVQPRGREELAWIGPSPAAAERARERRSPGGQANRPRRSVPTPWRARPSYPRKATPPAPRNPRRWVPSTPRVPTGGGMRSVCRSARDVAPGLAGMCRSISP